MALTCANIDSTFNSYVCDNTTPGIDTIYLTNMSNLSAYTISTGNVITSITMSAGTKFLEMRPYTETADASAISTINETGNITSLHNMKFKLNSVTTDSVQLGYKIFRANSVGIVKTSAGKYFLFGSSDSTSPYLQKGMTAKKYDVLNGVKSEDFNGIDLELEAKCAKPPFEIDSTLISAIVTAAS